MLQINSIKMNNNNLKNLNDYNPILQNNFNQMNQNNYIKVDKMENNLSKENSIESDINYLQENKSLSIIFKRSNAPNNIVINCKENDLISTIIERFKKKTNDYSKNLIFYYNGRLNENGNLTVIESGLKPNSIIKVYGD